MGRENDRDTYPIAPIIEHYGGPSMPEGYGERAIKCPFHPDSDASASINTNKQLFNCHASGDCPKGDAISVVMEWEKIGYREAVERVQAISGESMGNVRSTSTRSGRMAGGSRSKSGVRNQQRTWRRPERPSGA